MDYWVREKGRVEANILLPVLDVHIIPADLLAFCVRGYLHLGLEVWVYLYL